MANTKGPFLCLCILAQAILQTPGFQHLRPSATEVKIEIHQTVQRSGRLKRSVGDFPDEINLDFLYQGTRVDLKLRRNFNLIDEKLRIFLNEDGLIVEHRIPESARLQVGEAAYYYDVIDGSVFLVKHDMRDEHTGEFTFFGDTWIHNQQYHIHSPDEAHSSHTISFVSKKAGSKTDYVELFRPDKFDESLSDYPDKPERRQKRSTLTTYEIEILFVADYAVFKDFDNGVPGSEPNRAEVVRMKIGQHYSLMMNGIDVRYASLTNPKIECLVSGLFIAETPQAASFVEGHKIAGGNSGRDLVNATSALIAFGLWASNTSAGLPNHDHAMLFTGYDIGTSDANVFNGNTVGLTVLGGLCSQSDAFHVSINEYHGNIGLNASTAAHNLGHNLNASHNGDGNNCPEYSGYIMDARALTSAYDLTFNRNHWLFSSCTVAAFEEFINYLNKNNLNCMSSRQATSHSSFDQYISDSAGQLYPPDEQCKFIVGQNSYYFRGVLSDESDICAMMPCITEDNQNTYTINIAWDGTTCGLGKVCIGGNCENSTFAPGNLAEGCLFGDSPNILPNDTITCTQKIVGVNTGNLCNSSISIYGSLCCQTCANILATTVPTTSESTTISEITVSTTDSPTTSTDTAMPSTESSVTTQSIKTETSRARDTSTTTKDTPTTIVDKSLSLVTSQSPATTEESTPTTITIITTTAVPTTSASMKLIFMVKEYFDLSLHNSLQYTELSTNLKTQLEEKYNQRLKNSTVNVSIQDIWNGSVIVEFTIEYLNTRYAATAIISVTIDLVQGELTIDIFGLTVPALAAEISGITFTLDTVSDETICDSFVALIGGCGDSLMCEVTNEVPACMSISKETTRAADPSTTTQDTPKAIADTSLSSRKTSVTSQSTTTPTTITIITTTAVPTTSASMKLIFMVKEYFDLSLRNSLQYTELSTNLKTQLEEKYNQRLKNSTVNVSIQDIWNGSVIVEFTIEYLKTRYVATAIVSVTIDLVLGELTIDIFDLTVPAIAAEISGITFTLDTISNETICDSFVALIGGCGDNVTCEVTKEVPKCMSISKGEQINRGSPSTTLYVAVSSVVAVVVVIVIVVLIVLLLRRRHVQMAKLQSDSEENVSAYENADIELDETVGYTELSEIRPETTYAQLGGPRQTNGHEYYNIAHPNIDLKIHRLWSYIQYMKKDNCRVFCEEFERLQTDLAEKQTNQLGINTCEDRRRVVLDIDVDGTCDYINAWYINGYERVEKFIASQDPNNDIASDFWRMIWQQNSSMIVMFTKLYERGLHKGNPYWPGPGESEKVFGKINVKFGSEEDFGDFVVRKLNVSRGSKKAYTVTQYHFKACKDTAFPENTWSFVKFWRKVMADDTGNTRRSPSIVVQCSTDNRWTGTFIALDNLYHQAKTDGSLKPFKMLKTLTKQWTNIIHSKEQYVFLHEAVAEALLCGTSNIQADQYKEVYTFLTSNEAETGKSRMQLQYELMTESLQDHPDHSDGANEYSNMYNRDSETTRGQSSQNGGRRLNYIFWPDQIAAILVTIRPTAETLDEFWSFVAENEIKTFVVTSDAEGLDERTSSWLSIESNTSSFNVKSTNNKTDHGFQEKNLSFSRKHKEKDYQVSIRQFELTTWTDGPVPTDPTSVLRLYEAVKRWQPHVDESQPILVYCRDGSERSGLLYTVLTILFQLEADTDAKELNIFETVMNAKQRNESFIPNFEQYKFIHDVILEYLSLNQATEHRVYENYSK